MPKLPLILLLAATPAIAAPPVQPGQWEFTTTVTSVDMPGAPPAYIQQRVGKTTTTRRCITPEQAKSGLTSAFKARPECKITSPEGTDAIIDVIFACKAQDGATVTMATHGTSTPTDFTGTSSVVVDGPVHMIQRATSTGHRTGDCP